jgi:hypothetical protein
MSEKSMTKEPPKGPIKWMRRRLLPTGAKFAALGGLGILVLWILGRVLTDQFAWSQYLWWIPPIWAIGSAWGLLALSAILGKLSLRTGGMILRPILMLACVGCSIFLVFGVWRMHRAVLAPAAVQQEGLRILHWNQSAYKAWDRAAPVIIPEDPDVVLIVNSRMNRHRVALVGELEYMAPSLEEYRVARGIKANFQPDHFTVQGQALVASKLPIIRTGTVWLERIVDPETAARKTGQHAWVMFIELDLSEKYPDGPSSMVIWLVDLPSEPTLWRMTSMRAAVERGLPRIQWNWGLGRDQLRRTVPRARSNHRRFQYAPRLFIIDRTRALDEGRLRTSRARSWEYMDAAHPQQVCAPADEVCGLAYRSHHDRVPLASDRLQARTPARWSPRHAGRGSCADPMSTPLVFRQPAQF